MEDDTSGENQAGEAGAAPTIAVIIPCYNYARFVGRAIESVIDQNCAECECIVVDDASPDESWDVISRYDVRKFRKENAGPRNACLYGLERTSAPYVIFLDADDVLLPGSLDKILSVLDPEVAKVQFSLTQIDGDGDDTGVMRTTLEDGREREAIQRTIMKTGVYETPPTSGNLFRRDVAEILWDAEYDRFVDGVTLFAAPFLGDVVSIAEPLGAYRVHDNNISAIGTMPTPAAFEKDMDIFVKRMDHLRRIVEGREPGRRLPDARTFYYYRALAQTRTLASGKSPSLGGLWGILSALLREGRPLRKTLAFAGYAAAATLLPRKSAAALMTYRYKSSGRSMRGAISQVLRPGREPAAQASAE